MNLFLTILAILSTVALSQAATNNVLCYFESWVQWRAGNGKFLPQNVPASKCTHLVYSFILPEWTGNGNIAYFNDAATLNGLIQLKQQNPKLKVLAAIGGWGAGSAVFSKIAANAGPRANLVQSLSNFVNQYNLDGIDIDWEYPAQRDGAPADNVNFITFLRELRAKLGNNKIISAAVGASQKFVGTSYNVPEMNKYLTFINLMTYDFHTSADGKTGQNSPLYASSVDADKSLNADAAINKWIQSGAAPEKILLGLGFYGQSFTLANGAVNGVGAQAAATGNAGAYSQQGGFLTYTEICENLRQGGWNTVYDNQQQAVYSFKGNQWIGYDNVQSIKAKAQYAVSKKLGGVMTWAVDNDDLNNVCGQGSMPLLNAINSVIQH